MKLLLVLLFPIMIIAGPSENDTCYAKFSVPDVKHKNQSMEFINVCIDGYSYIYRKDNKTGTITIQQNWVIVDDQKIKSMPQTCSCDNMSHYVGKGN